jgi:hypothetical protein
MVIYDKNGKKCFCELSQLETMLKHGYTKTKKTKEEAPPASEKVAKKVERKK